MAAAGMRFMRESPSQSAFAWPLVRLSFHLAMTMTTVIMVGIIYLKYILPDTIVVKHAQNKFIPEHQKDWREYKW